MPAATNTSEPRRAAAGSSRVFPLVVAADRPYLLDASGQPFLLVGESAWSLLAQLSLPEIGDFLRDRRQRGYNAVLFNVLEAHFSNAPPRAHGGQVPFLVPSRFGDMAQYLKKVDFDTPNDAYFDQVEAVVRMAADLDMLVLAAPAYLGWEGGEQGWWQAVKRTDLAALRSYGRYLGSRFRAFDNLLWIQGGDFDATQMAPVDAIANGIREYMPGVLQTYHGGRGSVSHGRGGDDRWLNVGNVYTDEHVRGPARAFRARWPDLPYLLIEAYYEAYPAAPKDPRLARRQAYEAMLSGAFGQLSGHDAIWQFRADWREHLDSRTARSMSRLASLLGGLAWWQLQPDDEAGWLVNLDGPMQRGAGHDGPVAAVAQDRSWALAYLPQAGPVRIEPSALSGTAFVARWIDPAGNGEGPSVSLQSSDGPASLASPGTNAEGERDWLLMVAAR